MTKTALASATDTPSRRSKMTSRPEKAAAEAEATASEVAPVETKKIYKRHRYRKVGGAIRPFIRMTLRAHESEVKPRLLPGVETDFGRYLKEAMHTLASKTAEISRGSNLMAWGTVRNKHRVSHRDVVSSVYLTYPEYANIILPDINDAINAFTESKKQKVTNKEKTKAKK